MKLVGQTYELVHIFAIYLTFVGRQSVQGLAKPTITAGWKQVNFAIFSLDSKPDRISILGRFQPLWIQHTVADAATFRVKHPASGWRQVHVPLGDISRETGGTTLKQSKRASFDQSGTGRSHLASQQVDADSGAQRGQSGPHHNFLALPLYHPRFMLKDPHQHDEHNGNDTPFSDAATPNWRRFGCIRRAGHGVSGYPPPRPIAAWPIFHNGRNTPSASSNTRTPMTASKMGSIAADNPLML